MNCTLYKKSNFIESGEPISMQEFSHYIRKEYRAVMCKNCEFFVDPKIDLSIDEW